MSEISKTRMEVAIKCLERRAAKIADVPCFKSFPATDFDKEHLVMLCSLFADEWQKAQAKYLQATDRIFPSYIAGASAVCRALLHKPSIWSKAWNALRKKGKKE